jgi:NCS1 family nucleobase:cation symporter-1
VFCFAWFCNAAVHLGMGDLSILRYARSPSAAWASAAGMFLGHTVAWLCAALLFVYWVKVKGGDLEAAKAVPLGTMVNDAAGLAGLICIVVAGWTTANPTLYRAGLAFQGLFPKMSRATATLIAGAVCTVAGAFPAFATGLLEFVGIYGTVLAPVGAILFVDFWFARHAGLRAEWAHQTGGTFNTAALLAWLLPLGIGAWLYKAHDIFPSYLTLPVWTLAGLLYLLFARWLPQPTANSLP